MNTKDKKNVYQKIWGIQKEIKSLKKDELNKFQNYYYFEEKQVLEVLKPLLEKYQLSLLLSDDFEKEFSHVQQQSNHFIRYGKKLEIVDWENGDKLEFKFWACGQNTDLAKAKGSAETYANKYMLSKFFLIPVKDSLDSDNR